MSEGIRLSTELMNNIFESLTKHDPEVEKDLMVGLQYLSAVIGYFSAEYPGSDADRNELLEQLAAFTVQVADDRANTIKEESKPAAPAMPKGKSSATADPAVGIWKPE